MNYLKSTHIYYSHEEETKFSHYENLWKLEALKLLNNHVNPTQRKYWNILDVGSGRGEMLLWLKNYGYLAEGCDIDSVCVSSSSRYGICKQVDVMHLRESYSAGEYDTVIALHVLEHTENPKGVISQIRDISKSYIILAVPNLSSLALVNWSRRINNCNLGHHCGWNYSHFNNFLVNICNLKIIDWGIDCVRLYDTLPHLHWLDRFFHKTGIRKIFEERLLPYLFPRLSNSLIVLCEKKDFQRQ